MKEQFLTIARTKQNILKKIRTSSFQKVIPQASH